eukprot:Em0011g308a
MGAVSSAQLRSTSEVVPPVKIKCLRKPVLGATTGPATGVNDFPIETEKCLSSKDGNSTEERTRTVAGIPNWSRPLKQACGEAITLYDHIPGSSEHHGDPIADIYAVIARSNNAILALAEGCNWGPKSRQAACSAVQGCVGKLNDVLFSEHPPENIQQVVACIQESFDSAMESVTKCGSIMTSLCVAVVCPLAEAMEHKKWGLCVVCVGDTACLVWHNKRGIAFEVTYAARHMSEDVLLPHKGYLGFPRGSRAGTMDNRTCCYVPVADDDVVFLASGGIFNNFDPVALLQGTTEIDQRVKSAAMEAGDQSPNLPFLTPEGREDRKLATLTELLRAFQTRRKTNHLSALQLKEALIDHVVEVTEGKRNFLEKSWQDVGKAGIISDEERSAMEEEIFKMANMYPGKLEHAAVVAYQVGFLADSARYTRTNMFLYSPTVADLKVDAECEDSS